MKHTFMRRRLLGVAGLLLGWAALGSTGALAYPYVEEPGTLEFTGEMIVRPLPLEQALDRTLDDLAEARELRQAARDRVAALTVRYYPETDEYIIRVPKGSSENQLGKALLDTGAYEYVHPNWRCFIQATPNDPRYPDQWHHGVMQNPRAWDVTTGASGNVTVAIVDTGVQLTHPDLVNNLVPGYNAISGLAQVDGGVVNDQQGHGTHCAGCAAAEGNNGTGVAGVGWNLKIMPVRVTPPGTSGSTSLDAILRGARWAADNGAKLVSSSWSGISEPAINTTGSYLRSRGALYFYASGNNSANLSSFDWANVIVVGSTNNTDDRASTSAFGTAVDIHAPGVNILSTYLNSSYVAFSGTSMATPVAAGAAGLIWSALPTLTNLQVEDLLFRGARDLGDAGNDSTYGWGRVNPSASVALGSTFTRFRNPLTNRYYELVPAGIGWTQARTEAERRSHLGAPGRLAEMNTSGERSFFTSTYGTAALNQVWLGGTQTAGGAEPAGGWQWLSSRPFSPTFWATGQPNDANSNEDSLFMVVSNNALAWADGANNRSQALGFLVEYNVPINVSGTVNRQGWLGGTSAATVQLRDATTGAVLQTSEVNLSSTGSFSLTTSLTGPVTVSVVGPRYLRQTLTNRTITGDGISGLAFNLIPGDVDGDNAVTVFDYDALSAAFDRSTGDTGFNLAADLDGDGTVTVFDYDLLSANFDRVGDN